MGLDLHLRGDRLCFLLVSPGPTPGAVYVVCARRASLERAHEFGHRTQAVSHRPFHPGAVLLAATAVGFSSTAGSQCRRGRDNLRFLDSYRGGEEAVGASGVAVGNALPPSRAPWLEPRVRRS